jgi:hypothetical protein
LTQSTRARYHLLNRGTLYPWQRAKAASERDGKLVERVESVFMKAKDYSPMR